VLVVMQMLPEFIFPLAGMGCGRGNRKMIKRLLKIGVTSNTTTDFEQLPDKAGVYYF
jgi:hypothetical protein